MEEISQRMQYLTELYCTKDVSNTQRSQSIFSKESYISDRSEITVSTHIDMYKMKYTDIVLEEENTYLVIVVIVFCVLGNGFSSNSKYMNSFSFLFRTIYYCNVKKEEKKALECRIWAHVVRDMSEADCVNWNSLFESWSLRQAFLWRTKKMCYK